MIEHSYMTAFDVEVVTRHFGNPASCVPNLHTNGGQTAGRKHMIGFVRITVRKMTKQGYVPQRKPTAFIARSVRFSCLAHWESVRFFGQFPRNAVGWRTSR